MNRPWSEIVHKTSDERLAAYEIFTRVLGEIDNDDPAWDKVADGLDALVGDCWYMRPDGTRARLDHWRPK
jgi:hypothetical protein